MKHGDLSRQARYSHIRETQQKVRFFHTAPLIAVTIFTAAAVRQKTAPFSIVAIFLVFVPSLS